MTNADSADSAYVSFISLVAADSVGFHHCLKLGPENKISIWILTKLIRDYYVSQDLLKGQHTANK